MAWMMYLEDEYKTHLKDYRQKKEAKVEVSEQKYRAEIAGQYITDLQTDDADHAEKPYPVSYTHLKWKRFCGRYAFPGLDRSRISRGQILYAGCICL